VQGLQGVLLLLLEGCWLGCCCWWCGWLAADRHSMVCWHIDVQLLLLLLLVLWQGVVLRLVLPGQLPMSLPQG
jgi:hypothetical protein